MPLQLPNLDDRSYDDLVAEALTLIPSYSPEWTNHNPSDPGIALIELLAYLTDMLLYRLNRVTDENVKKFIQLLKRPPANPLDPARPPEPPITDLREAIRLAVLGVRERYRAVTADDYEFLSTESFNQSLKSSGSAIPLVARAHCVPQRNLEEGTEEGRTALKVDHVSVVIIPEPADPASQPPQPPDDPPQPRDDQSHALSAFLDKRRMLTTKIHITGPLYVPVIAELVIARKPDTLETAVSKSIADGFKEFFRLLPNDNGPGWSFGRDVFVSDIYNLLEKLPGIDFITDIMLSSSCARVQFPRCVAADQIWHEEGTLIGLRLQRHHLPVLQLPQIVIAPAMLPTDQPSDQVVAPLSAGFVIVKLHFHVKPKPGIDSAGIKRDIRLAVRRKFSPLYDGPKPDSKTGTNILLSDITALVRGLSGVADVHTDLQCIPDQRLLKQETTEGIRFNPGQVADLRVEVDLSQGAV